MSLRIIELLLAKLFPVLVLLELVLISLEHGSQTKVLRSTFQIQLGQLIEVLLRSLDLNGKIIDTMTENLEVSI
jgi:hypothetical protein